MSLHINGNKRASSSESDSHSSDDGRAGSMTEMPAAFLRYREKLCKAGIYEEGMPDFRWTPSTNFPSYFLGKGVTLPAAREYFNLPRTCWPVERIMHPDDLFEGQVLMSWAQLKFGPSVPWPECMLKLMANHWEVAPGQLHVSFWIMMRRVQEISKFFPSLHLGSQALASLFTLMNIEGYDFKVRFKGKKLFYGLPNHFKTWKVPPFLVTGLAHVSNCTVPTTYRRTPLLDQGAPLSSHSQAEIKNFFSLPLAVYNLSFVEDIVEWTYIRMRSRPVSRPLMARDSSGWEALNAADDVDAMAQDVDMDVDGADAEINGEALMVANDDAEMCSSEMANLRMFMEHDDLGHSPMVNMMTSLANVASTMNEVAPLGKVDLSTGGASNMEDTARRLLRTSWITAQGNYEMVHMRQSLAYAVSKLAEAADLLKGLGVPFEYKIPQ